MTNLVFFAAEPVQITGYQRECDCSHCGRPLKVGVKLAGFVGSYVQRLKGAPIRERAIIAGKGQDYAKRTYGWDVDGPNFRLVLKTPLQSI